MSSESTEEKFCTICFDTIENTHWIMHSGETRDPQFCSDCTTILLNSRLDNFMDEFIKEKCLATISRVCKSTFPEYLSIDGTGYGETIKQICTDDKVFEPIFTSSKSDEYVQNFKNALNSLKDIVLHLDNAKQELNDNPSDELKEQVEHFETLLSVEKANAFQNL